MLTLPLDYTAIERILPHRYPFLLVDRVTELEPDKRIVGIKNISLNERYLAHSGTDEPSLPPTILTEAVAQVGARLVRGRIDHLLEGDGATVRQVEVVFGAGDQLHDLTTYSLHSGERTVGDLLAKGVFAGRARGYIKGVTTIPRSGRGTNSYLGEFGMLLSKTARSVAIPSLWIDQPDCERAAHGSSVGPIDPAQIFYLRSRGLTDAEARRTIVMGFLEPVVAALPLDAEAERLREVLAAKLDAALASAPAALAS